MAVVDQCVKDIADVKQGELREIREKYITRDEFLRAQGETQKSLDLLRQDLIRSQSEIGRQLNRIVDMIVEIKGEKGRAE